MEKNVQLKYRLYRRRNGIFYWQENDSSKQGTLRTNDRREAERLLNAMNESHREPTLNLNLARAYLAAHDPRMAKRTWQAVMDEMATHGIPATQQRCARGFRSKAYHPIRNKPLVQTTGADLLTIIHDNGNCVAHYLRRLHNLAVDLGWLAWPILAKRAWPKVRSKSKRAITAKEQKQSSPRKKMRSAAPTMNCFTRPVPPKPMQQISQQKTLTGKTAFLFIAAKNSDRSASPVD
jgi:hypothetical protein